MGACTQNKAGELRAGIATHAPQEAQHYAFVGAFEASIAKAAHRSRHELVAFIGTAFLSPLEYINRRLSPFGIRFLTRDAYGGTSLCDISVAG